MDKNNRNTPGPNKGKQKYSWVRSAALYLSVALIIFLLVFFFVKPYSGGDSSRTVTINNTSITKRDEVDENGNQIYEGELATILSEYNVIRLETQIVGTDPSVHLVGGYYYLPIIDEVGVKYDTKTRYTFQGYLEEPAYGYFLDLISNRLSYKIGADGYITNVVETDSNGNEVKFYNSKIYRTLVPSSSSWTSWIPYIVMIGASLLLGFFVIRSFNKGMKNNIGAANEVASSRARREIHSKTRFKDVAGCDEVKSELIELVDYFTNADKYTRLGATLPKGVLLVGPPGTGKTLLAKAVAGEANVPFYSISGSDFVEMYVGVGASRVRDMFKTAKQNAPCLIFIDEIDAVGRQRGAGLGGGNDEREQTLNQLLVEMDGFEDNSGVIIVAATNRADVLDPALTRAGRFDRQITVDLPDKEGREAIFKVHARNKTIAPDVDFGSIASRTTGFSGADIANIINDAAILAVRANRTMVTTQDIDEAIDRSIAGPAKSNKTMLESEKKRVAYHESGHAIVGLYLEHSDKVQKVTIVPRGRTGGHVLMTPENDRFLLNKRELEARITGYLAGRTSEEIFFDDISTGASNDIEVATRIAKSMVTEYGMSPLGPIQYEKAGGSVFLGRDYNDTQKNFSSKIANEIDEEVRNIVERCHEEARKILTEHKDDVILMAETLIKVETLTAEQITYLLEHRELPKVEEHVLTEEEIKELEMKAKTKPELFDIDYVMGEIAKSFKPEETELDNPGKERFLQSFKSLLNIRPDKIVLLAEASPDKAKAYDVDTLKKYVSNFTESMKYGYFVLSLETLRIIGTTAAELGQNIEKYTGISVLLIESDSTSISNFTSTVR